MEQLQFKRQNNHGTIDIAASNPAVRISQVNNWATLNLPPLQGDNLTPLFPSSNAP